MFKIISLNILCVENVRLKMLELELLIVHCIRLIILNLNADSVAEWLSGFVLELLISVSPVTPKKFKALEFHLKQKKIWINVPAPKIAS